jgi:hypothetical protein
VIATPAAGIPVRLNDGQRIIVIEKMTWIT